MFLLLFRLLLESGDELFTGGDIYGGVVGLKSSNIIGVTMNQKGNLYYLNTFAEIA